MKDYLIDALVLFFQYFSGVVLAVATTYLILVVMEKVVVAYVSDEDFKKNALSELDKTKGWWKLVLVVGLILSLGFTLSSSRLQFKRDPVDSENVLTQQQQQIQESYEETRDQPIVDRSLKPRHTEEEREDRFNDMVDWKNRE